MARQASKKYFRDRYKRPEIRKKLNQKARDWFKKWYSDPKNRQRNLDKVKENRKKYPEKFRIPRLKTTLKRMGSTYDFYLHLLAQQNNCCAVCERPFHGETPRIDHCHATGKIRGLLHNKCNVLLGNASEDTHVLQGAIKYLEKHSQVQVEVSLKFQR